MCQALARGHIAHTRLYGNAIAMRAAQDRLLRRHKHNKAVRTERMFEQNVIRLAEGSFVIEAVDAATSLVKCGVTMQKKGILRYCPCRTFMRLVSGLYALLVSCR